jgi:hypothetical protein
MAIWKTIVPASLLCAAVAAVLLFGRPEAAGLNAPLPNELVAEPVRAPLPSAVTPAESPVDRRPVERGAVVESPATVPPPPDAVRRLRKALDDGAVSTLDVQLPDAESWERFSVLWDDLSTSVRRTEGRRDGIGVRLSRDRFAKGECTRIPDDGLQKNPDGSAKPIGVWREKRHPQEWVSNRCSYREGEGQIFEQVRIMPGENQELDSANGELESAVRMRTEAVKRFFVQFAGAPPDKPSGH